MTFKQYLLIRDLTDDILSVAILTGKSYDEVSGYDYDKFKSLLNIIVDEIKNATTNPVEFKGEVTTRLWYTVQTSSDPLLDVAVALIGNPFDKEIKDVLPVVLGFMMRCSELSNRTLTYSVRRLRVQMSLQRKLSQFTGFFSTWYNRLTRPFRKC